MAAPTTIVRRTSSRRAVAAEKPAVATTSKKDAAKEEKKPKPAAKAKAAGKRTASATEPEDDTETDGSQSQQPSKRARSNKGSETSGSDEDVKKINQRMRATKLEAKKSDGSIKEKKVAGASKAARKVCNALQSAPEHTRPANQLFIWGAGNFGQFGMGPEHLGEFEKPRKNTWMEKKIESGEEVFGESGAGIEAIAAGGLHTMFIDEKGTVWSCGVNDDAALGRVTTDVPDPEKEGETINIDILTSFPYPLQTLVDEGFRAVSVAAGDSICAAVSDEGELRVWGSFRANEGSLGFSNGAKYQFTPAPILSLSKDEKVSSVAAGNNHLVVLTTHGNIYTWGAGEQGQLGRKIIERRKIHGTTPEKVTLKSRSTKAVAVGAGNYSSYAVDEKGGVWGWGLNSWGQIGTGNEDEDDNVVPQPRLIDELSPEALGEGVKIVQIAGGEHHTLFLASDGRVFACGRGQSGQLGLPADHPEMSGEDHKGAVFTPTHVPFPDSHTEDKIIHISAGTHSNLAVAESGALYSWGEGNQGELGLGDEMEATTPTVVVRKEGGSWKAISAACGGQHSLGMFRKKN